MAITSVGHDAPTTTTNIRPEFLRLRAIYDRPRLTSPQHSPSQGEGAGDWWRSLTSRRKVWGLAKYSPFLGWVPVAYFATFEEANRHRAVMERATGLECAISHWEDGAVLRAYELYINRLRLGGGDPQRINRAFVEAQVWAARYGYSVSSELCLGLVCLYLIELMEVG
jgi:hypothetical protein